MISRRQVFEQSKYVVSQLVLHSLCCEQNYPIMKQLGKDTWHISIGERSGYSIAMRDLPYKEIYSSLSTHKLFSIKMIDGALIQMLYEFKDDELLYHRLAFFPSPDLEEYQSNPELYELDEVYADILMKEIVPFPIRFDFNKSNEKYVIVDHPKSHLTLGQYKNCRIPVTAPLTPFLFLNFILRNFYNTAFKKVTDTINFRGELFEEIICVEETNLPHFKLPQTI